MKLCIKESYPEQELYAVAVLDSEWGQGYDKELTLLTFRSLGDAEDAELAIMEDFMEDPDTYTYFEDDEDYDDVAMQYDYMAARALDDLGITGVYVVSADAVRNSDTWDNTLVDGCSINIINRNNILEFDVPSEFK